MTASKTRMFVGKDSCSPIRSSTAAKRFPHLLDSRKHLTEFCFMRIRAIGVASRRRIERNTREADELEAQGYDVERNMHRNGAYFAVIGNHQEHEKEVGHIFAENGFSFTLDREGNAKVRINGRLFTLPSVDGRVEGFTHEIAALQGEPDGRTVARAISHSHKPFVYDQSKSIQADIAITIAPMGSKYSREHITAGVKAPARATRPCCPATCPDSTRITS